MSRLLPEGASPALPARGTGGQELRGRPEVPLVGALPRLHQRGDVVDERLLEEDGPAGFAVEGHDRHAPDPLARDGPVGAVGDHVGDALLAPGRDPLHGGQGGEGLLAQRPDGAAARCLVQRDEPLLGRPEQRRVLAPPAVGIRVGERDLRDQRAALPEERDDPGVRLPDGEAREVRDLGDEPPVVVDRVVDRQPERPAELVVLLAVPRRDVDQAGPRVHRDERGARNPARPLDPRMPVLEPDELGALERGEAPRRLEPRDPGKGVGETGGNDEGLAVHVERDVLLARVHRDGEVGRQRPRRRGPDDDRRARRGREARQGRHQRELHVDRRRLLVLVLDLGLGQRGLAVHAPVHGLETLVDEAPAHEAAELPHDRRLVGGRHREVGPAPVAEDPEPPKLRALDVDEPERVRPAAAALLGGIHRAPDIAPSLVETELLVDLVLDGQAVAIPPRDVDGVVAQHRPRLHHDVLEDLVERGPHVDVPVRVGRAVVEDPAGAALPARPQLPVEIRRVPSAEELRLPLGQARPHGEVRPRELEGRLVVHETGNCAAVVPPRSGRKRSIHAYLCQGTPPGGRAEAATGRPGVQPPAGAGQAPGARARSRCQAVS